MGSLIEHAVARRTVGNASRVVGSPAILEGIIAQNLPRCRDRKEEGAHGFGLEYSGRNLRSGSLRRNSYQTRGRVVGLRQCAAALGSRCQAEGESQTQTIKNETISVNKAPIRSKEMSPKLDDGAGGFPPKDGDGGGGGGGGGGGWGAGGFVFWALILLVGFLRDRELEKPYKIKPKRMKRPSMA